MTKNVLQMDQYEMEKYLFHKGESFKSYQFFGAHRRDDGSMSFSVWAPNARKVSLVGDFNAWNSNGYEMKRISENGIYNIILKDISEGDAYKYEIVTKKGKTILKADPYAFHAELRPKTASRVYALEGYAWQDQQWLRKRKMTKVYTKPVNIYEMHFGSWMKKPDGNFNSYEEMIELLVPYLVEHGYTHVELMPLSEHPFDGSWGYQTTGYFAATSRYGDPKGLMALIDACHQSNVGVILDWVPCHFCKDDHGISYFDGDYCYESAYEFIAYNHQWGTNHFDFTRKEVWSFLLSNATFWFDYFHIDGLRVDAVAFMLYTDHGKEPGSLKNEHGGNHNLQAIEFIKTMNKHLFGEYPGILMIAEESTTWPKVTHPIHEEGLGFNFKWNMGWMNDTLKYFSMDYDERQASHHLLTFSLTYAFTENYLLPFSHDEVVHGKKSLIGRMPGDYWQKFANTRALLGYLMTHPGKKLTFMGNELAQFIEWDYKRELDWFLLAYESHRTFHHFSKALNHFYLNHPALFEEDSSFKGFKWIDCDNHQQSLLIFERRGKKRSEDLIVVLNFNPETHREYFIGVPGKSVLEEVFNSDWSEFGGSGVYTGGEIVPEKKAWQGQPYRALVNIPPLSCVIYGRKG